MDDRQNSTLTPDESTAPPKAPEHYLPGGGSRQHIHQRPQHPLANYQFSSEELRVLRECNSESFFQRSLPIGTSLGLATYYGVKRGFLTPNPKYGAVPKVVVSVIIGYFMGKFSYQRKCAEKFMQLPNSKLGEILRQKRRTGGDYDSFRPDQGIGSGFGFTSPFGSTTTTNPDIYTEDDLKMEKGNSLDLNFDRPTEVGLEDYLRPTIDNTPSSFDNTASTIEQSNKPLLSYDELRKKNREEYGKKSQQNIFNRPLQPGGGGTPIIRSPSSGIGTEKPPLPSSTPDEFEGISSADVPKRKNRYGDVWS